MRYPISLMKQKLIRDKNSTLLKKFLVHLILLSILLTVLGYVYRLNREMILLLWIEALFLLPWLIQSYDRYLFEKRRFEDVVNYLETMLYSFKKKPKIINALEDSYELTTGKMKGLIKKIHQSLVQGKSNDYQTLFYEMESSYPCRRMKEIHLFLIDIELLGGDYLEQIELLLEDLDIWNEHIFYIQKERELIKKRVILSILLSLLIMGSSLMMVPSSMDITHMPIYQWTTSFVVGIFLFLYVFIQTRLQYSWLDDIDEKRQIWLLQKQKQYQNLNIGKLEKRCIMGISFALVATFLMRQWLWSIICILLITLVWNMKKWQKRRFDRYYCRELEIVFPIWLRSLGLHLQTENVHRSIQHSLSRSPKLLVPYLEKLILEINEYPGSMLPYVHFLDEYSLPFVSRAMKSIYALLEYGQEKSKQQIHALLRWNMHYVERSEKLLDEQKLSGFGLWIALPMLLSSMKMMVDLCLLCIYFLKVGR